MGGGRVRRKEQGRWLVAHEHHSFPLSSTGEQAVRAVHEGWFAGTAAKDLDGMMAHVAEDVVSYEHDVPRQVLGRAGVREVCRTGLERSTGAVAWHVPEMAVVVRDDLAVAWGLNSMSAELPDGTTVASTSRGTCVFRRRGGEWEMVHQHLSYPHDPETGRAVWDLPR